MSLKKRIRRLRRGAKRVVKRVIKVGKKVVIPVTALTLIPGAGAAVARGAVAVAKSVAPTVIATKIAGKRTTSAGEIAVADDIATAVVDNKPIATSSYVLSPTDQAIPVKSLGTAENVKALLTAGGQILTQRVMEKALNRGVQIEPAVQRQVIQTSVTPADYTTAITEGQKPDTKKVLIPLGIAGVAIAGLVLLSKKK